MHAARLGSLLMPQAIETSGRVSTSSTISGVHISVLATSVPARVRWDSTTELHVPTPTWLMMASLTMMH